MRIGQTNRGVVISIPAWSGAISSSWSGEGGSPGAKEDNAAGATASGAEIVQF